MKRKVIQIAESTMLVSLPRKWVVDQKIKKGDELEVEEQGSKLIISAEKSSEEAGGSEIEVDITGLDSSTIKRVLRSVYIKGYDSIKITFNSPMTTHYRTNENERVFSVILEELKNLTAFEIIQQKEKFCWIKSISRPSMKEFDNLLRRIFILIVDASNDLMSGIKNKDWIIIETVEEKHSTITKLVSYCLRLLNQRNYPDHSKINFLYHTIADLGKVMDVIKYTGRDLLEYKPSLSQQIVEMISLVNESYALYYKLFYDFKLETIRELNKIKDEIKNTLKNQKWKNVPSRDILVVNNMVQSLEILVDLIEARTSMEY